MKHQGTRSRSSLIGRARELRQRSTDAERVLWNILRDRRMRHWKFRRQHQIEGFNLDFYCPRLRLCIELDGEPHFDESGRRYDALRTRRLADIGILVLRIENRDIIVESRDHLAGDREGLGRARKRKTRRLILFIPSLDV